MVKKSVKKYNKSSESNPIRTHNYVIRKRTLNHLAKLVIECGFTLKLVRDMMITCNQ